MTNFYKILGVDDFAPAGEITTAYRKLSKKFHPDVNDGDPFFEARFKEIQNAYEILGNSGRRRKHDALLKHHLLVDEQLESNRLATGHFADVCKKNKPSFITIFNVVVILLVLVALIILFQYKVSYNDYGIDRNQRKEVRKPQLNR
jgi:DnaJ-class molecular chaperone